MASKGMFLSEIMHIFSAKMTAKNTKFNNQTYLRTSKQAWNFLTINQKLSLVRGEQMRAN